MSQADLEPERQQPFIYTYNYRGSNLVHGAGMGLSMPETRRVTPLLDDELSARELPESWSSCRVPVVRAGKAIRSILPLFSCGRLAFASPFDVWWPCS
jgi:hypothetical protein